MLPLAVLTRVRLVLESHKLYSYATPQRLLLHGHPDGSPGPSPMAELSSARRCARSGWTARPFRARAASAQRQTGPLRNLDSGRHVLFWESCRRLETRRRGPAALGPCAPATARGPEPPGRSVSPLLAPGCA